MFKKKKTEKREKFDLVPVLGASAQKTLPPSKKRSS